MLFLLVFQDSFGLDNLTWADPSQDTEEILHLTAVTFLFALVIFLGTLGNVTLAVSLIKRRVFKNHLLLNLCVSDTLVCSVSAPITLYFLLPHSSALGSYSPLMCKLMIYFQVCFPVVTFFCSCILVSKSFYDFKVRKTPTKKNLL